LVYFWLKEKWGRWAALVGAIVYVYTPYRFLDVYVRGSLGEAVAFIFPPLIFWSLDKLEKKNDHRWLAVGSLALAGLIMAHNTLAMLFIFLFGGYLIFHYLFFHQKKVFFRQLNLFWLGLAFSTFFWLPALSDRRFVRFGQTMVSNFFLHFPTLKQLIIPSWGFGPSLPLSAEDLMSFQIGLINLIIVFLVFLFLAKKFFFSLKRKKLIKDNWAVFYFLLAFLALFFLMTNFSFWLWRFSFIENLIQFPWRLLSLTTFITAFLAGFLIQSIKAQKKASALAFAFIFLAIFLNWPYTRPEGFVNRGEAYYATNEGTTTVANEYLPIWVKELPASRAKKKVEIIEGQGEVGNLFSNSRKISFTVNSKTQLKIQVNSLYFPGWRVRVDGVLTPIDFKNQKGVIQFLLSPGHHFVVVSFGETPLRALADVISLTSLLLFGGWLVRRSKNEALAKKN